VHRDESLSALIHLAIGTDLPIIVKDNGENIGVITRSQLLTTVIEGTEVS